MAEGDRVVASYRLLAAVGGVSMQHLGPQRYEHQADRIAMGEAPDVFGRIVLGRRRGVGAISNREQRTHKQS
jgi:hypothetical protein